MIDRNDFEDRMRGAFPPPRYPHTTARRTLQALAAADARAQVRTTQADGTSTTSTAAGPTCDAAQAAMEAAGLGAVVRVTPQRGGE